MSDTFEFDVFLSHNSKDKPAVRALAQALRAHGLRVWLDEDELQPGQPWQEALEQIIETTKSAAVLIGKDSMGPWEDREMRGCLSEFVDRKLPVIPVLLPSVKDKPKLPLFLKQFTWVDLRSGASEEGLAKLIWGITGKKPKKIESATGPSTSGEVVIAPTRQRHGAEHLFGREKELADLDRAWDDSKTHIMTIVAWGGVGKTSLVVEWMARMSAKGWPGFERVFDWSFYSQGTREQGAASADTFMAEALKFFGDEQMAASSASAWDKGARLAKLVAQYRTLLVLDGVEPLQYPPGPMAGQLKDPALTALLKGLAQQNRGVCLVTTREHMADLAPFRDTTAPEWDLENLSVPAGVELLKTLGVKGSEDEFNQLVKDIQGHALTLNLLGCFLVKAHKGDIRKHDLVKFEKADAKIQGGHAFKMMAAYEKWLAEEKENGARCLAVLRLLGLFDRPANAECLAALRKEPAIAGLTEPLVGLGEDDWNLTVSMLIDCRLISEHSIQGAIDAHPLIREYFAKQLCEQNLKGWRAAHKRLYEHLAETTEYQPNTLEGLQPLYQAVVHGCQAGLHEDARAKVYRDRILRGTGAGGFYSTRKLGAIGADLGAVSCFFEQPWCRLAPGIKESDQAWLQNEAAYFLRALGRLTEALEPFHASMKLCVDQENWREAAIRAGNLSELELTLGKVADALRDAENAVEYGNRTKDDFERQADCVILADALHQAGQRDKALARFREAEKMQAERQPEYPLLYSQGCFRYCDLLLAEGERGAWHRSVGCQPVSKHGQAAHATLIARCREVEKRAAQALKWEESMHGAPILDFALQHLTLGRVALCRTVLTDSKRENAKAVQTARSELTAAVDGLRKSGYQDDIPRGLLSRAWLRAIEGDLDGARADLDEAWEIAERGPMKLFMADIHMYRARLFFREKEYPWTSPKDDLAAARKLIDECGYHRRDAELADAEAAIG